MQTVTKMARKRQPKAAKPALELKERERIAQLIDDDWFAALGERMAADPSKAQTMVECFALMQHNNRKKWELIERDGCCGGQPDAEGICYGVGRCPRVDEAGRFARFANGFLEWLDQLENESALAAAAARLCVSEPVLTESPDV